MPNGFINDVMFAKNADFSGSATTLLANGLTADNQLWVGSTALNAGGTNINVMTLTPGAGITLTRGAGTLTISASGGAAATTLSDDVGTIVTPLSNNIQLLGHVVNQTGTFHTSVSNVASHLLSINPMAHARWIVDPLGFNGTHTTIGAALAAATAGDTIFLMPGTYTENPTLVAGVNITAWPTDGQTGPTGASSPVVKIVGTLTASFSGSCSLSGIQFQTNGSNILSITGSNTTIVNCIFCNFNVTNATAI